MGRWRTGRKLVRTMYLDDKLVGMMDTPELATMAVASLNEEGAAVAQEAIEWAVRALSVLEKWRGMDDGTIRHDTWHSVLAARDELVAKAPATLHVLRSTPERGEHE